MPAKPTHNPEYIDPDHEAIVTFANTYFDDDDEREALIDTLMERRGYRRTTGWAPPPEPDPAGQGGGGAGPAGPRRPAYFKQR